MRSKTKKLIWAAPLLAVFAVAAALAIFAVQTPGAAQADGALPGPVTGLSAKAGTAADGSPTIILSWTAPAVSATAGAAAGYRIDRSEDAHIWEALVANTGNLKTTYTDATAGYSGVWHYRVFAINHSGTGPSSISPSSIVGVTGAKPDATVKAPGPVLNLTAKAISPREIELNWSPPTSDGGSDLLRYCIVWGTATLGTAVPTAAASASGNQCLVGDAALGTNAPGTPNEIAFAAFDADGNDKTKRSITALTANTTYHFRAFAVNQETTAAMGASDVSSNTVSVTTPSKYSKPTDLIFVLDDSDNADDDAENVDFYWTWPMGETKAVATGFVNTFQYQQATADTFATGVIISGGSSDTHSAGGTDGVDGPQFANADITQNAFATNTLKAVYYRVSALGPTGNVVTSGLGDWSKTVKVPMAEDPSNAGQYGVPFVKLSETQPALVSFTASKSATHPDTRINLVWKDNDTINTTTNVRNHPRATGYTIHYRVNPPTGSNSPWQVLEDDTAYSGGGQTYTHYDAKRGTSYQYRIFPYFNGKYGAIYGKPMFADATTDAEPSTGLPGHVRGLTVTATAANALKLDWPAVTMTGGSPIIGYRIQVAPPTALTPDLPTSGSDTWKDIEASRATNFTTVGAGMVTYTYMPTGTKALELGDKRWFRVFAINEVNDVAKIVDNALIGAEPKAGTTASTMAPGVPRDVTAETSRDSTGKLRTDRGVDVHWNLPDNVAEAGVEEYEVERKTRASSDASWSEWTLIGGVPGTGRMRTYYNDTTEPAENEERMYRVRATNSIGKSDYSNIAEYPVQPHSHNNDPAATDMAIDPVTVRAGADPHTMDVSGHFSDADGDALTYSATSDMPAIATASIPADSSMLTISGVAAGSATVTVSASDGMGGTDAMKTIMVTVTAANMAPTLVGTIPDVDVKVGETHTSEMAASTYFNDPDAPGAIDDPGAMLTIAVGSSDDDIATATINDGGKIAVTGVAAGMATITVTATDAAGASIDQTFDVTVAAVLAAPMNVVSDPVGSGIMIVRWDAVAGAAGYYVIVVAPGDASDVGTAVINNPAGNRIEAAVRGLKPAQKYNVLVSAFGGGQIATTFIPDVETDP